MSYLDAYNEGDYDIQKATEAQKELANLKDAPFFPPLSGLCWSCSENIYLAEDQMKLVTAAQNGGVTNEEMKALLDEMGFESSKDIEKNQLNNILEAVSSLSFQKVLKNKMD